MYGDTRNVRNSWRIKTRLLGKIVTENKQTNLFSANSDIYQLYFGTGRLKNIHMDE